MPQYIIQLSTDGEGDFSANLGNAVIFFVTKYNVSAGCWTLDILSADSTPLLSGLSLVPGVDLLKPYQQLKRILGSLEIFELNAGDYMSPYLLGDTVKLVWTPPE